MIDGYDFTYNLDNLKFRAYPESPSPSPELKYIDFDLVSLLQSIHKVATYYKHFIEDLEIEVVISSRAMKAEIVSIYFKAKSCQKVETITLHQIKHRDIRDYIHDNLKSIVEARLQRCWLKEFYDRKKEGDTNVLQRREF